MEEAAAASMLTVTPSSVAAGTSVTVNGNGFPANQTVRLTLDGSSTGMPSVTSKKTGTFTTSLTIPAQAAAGQHTLKATSGAVAASAIITVTVPTTATATSTPPATATSTSVATAAPTSTSTTPSATTTLFSDTFDSGTTAAWDGSTSNGTSSNVSVSAAATYAGSYGLDTAKLGTNDNGHAEVFKNIGAPTSKIVSLRTRMRVTSRSGAGVLNLQRLYRSSPVYGAVVAIQHNGTAYSLQMRRIDGSAQNVVLSTQLVTGTWYDVELVYDWSSAQPVATAYVNGTVAATITDATAGTLYAPDSVYAGLFETSWTQQAEVQWDSVSAANGVQSTTTNTSNASAPIAAPTSATPAPTTVPTSAATATPIPTTSPTTAPTSSSTTTAAAPVAVKTGGDEWNQDGHDAQHTGATSEEPWTNWTFAWGWNGPDANGGSTNNTYRAPSEARTVVGAGNLYAPAGTTGLYALALADGHPVWHTTVATFNATPAFDPTTGALFAGASNGTLYKFNPATGAVLATYNAGAPLDKAVIVAAGAVIVTDANSNLHKLDAATLNRQWVYTSGCSAECAQDTPPAFSPSRNALLYAAGDLVVHAVNFNDGSRKWSTKPTPRTPGFPNRFSLGWPVIAEQHGIVLLRMQTDENYVFDYPTTGGIYPNTNAAVRSYLQANPDHQNLFALSLDNGSTPFLPAVGYGSVDGLIYGIPGYTDGSFYRLMPGQPVVKTWPNGDEVVYIQFRNGSASPPDGRWDAHMGEMTLDSTTVPGLQPGDLRFVKMSRWNAEGGDAYTQITDEQYPLTIAGSTLMYTGFTGMSAVRLTDRSPTLGLSYTNQIATANLPPVIRRLQTCADFHPNTHFAACNGLVLYNDSRYWDGPGFWVYWNQMDPGITVTANQAAWDIWSPRYTYVSNGLLVVEGEAGDLFVLAHPNTPPPGAAPILERSGTPAPAPTSTPTPTSTNAATATPTTAPANPAAPAAGPLGVGNLSVSASSVSQFDKLELTVPVTGTSATNLQFPYDPVGAAGLTPGIGISVEGEFLPPGQTDWTKATIQPGFLYQDYQRQQVNGSQWLYPNSTPSWKVRFAAQQQGSWQVRVRAQDASVCSAGANPCTSWVRTNPTTFNVGAPRANNHGFLQVSPSDSRYFQFSDGTPFFGQGIDTSFGNDTYAADNQLATEGANGTNFLRVWMDGQDIAGSSWSPWWAFGGAGYGGYLPESGLQNAPAGSGHDFVFQLTPSQPCIMNGHTQAPISVKPATAYRLTTVAQVTGLVAANSAAPAGFAVKTGLWPANNSCPGGITPSATPLAPTGNTNGFTTLSGSLTTAAGQQFLDNLYLTLDNASAGQALVTSVALQEVLPGGSLGPNLLAKSNSDMHQDFNQPASWQWDHTIDTAAQNGVYLKLVVLEKNDRVWNRINSDGTLGTSDSNTANFYASAGTKVRQLQQYYWRYLTARWGYATSVHSWELVNEGDGGAGHAAATDAFAQFTHQTDPNRHMVSSSIWAGYPADAFWANPQYPNIDYADLHAYVSTGFGSPYAWDAPTGTTLETDTTKTYQASPGAIRAAANVTSSSKDVPVRGQGTWTVKAMVKADSVVGTCPYGAPASLAGPQLDVSLSGGPHIVVPQDATNPTQYWICTAQAGTYDYTPVQGTFTVPDSAWHTLSLSFKTTYATAGTVWWDNLQVISPDGRQVRVFGKGSFDDHQRFDYDTGLFNSAFGLLDGGASVSGAGKPLVRGETGIDNAGGPQTELAQLANDTHGVWLHNFLWGALNPGGMYDLYWWTDNITKNNLFFQYKPVRDFMAGIPISNGHYQDAQPVVTNTSSVGAMGQKDLTTNSGYVWIRNTNHTWYNVVNNVTWGRLNGSVSVSGLAANKAYSVALWEFDDPGNLTNVSSQVTSDASGKLTIALDTLPSTVTDLAVKFS